MNFAANAEGQRSGFRTAGVVLVIVGAIGAFLSIAYWAGWGRFGDFGPRQHPDADV
ncbi:MAG: hypothetical protein M0Z47_05295 [Actinomycetota bacterium]|nr:hypothetical protein [Actinomycetota bacterium]